MTASENPDGHDWGLDRDSASALFAEWSSEDAVNLLANAQPANDPDGKRHALIGLALFHLERYAKSAEYYRKAVSRDGGVQDWQIMLRAAEVNAATQIHVPVPPRTYFNKDELLAPPDIPPGTLPSPPGEQPIRGLPTRLRLFAGEALGRVACVAVDAATAFLGRFPGYRGRVWTNWDERPYLIGLLILAHMRTQLNKHNLMNTYPAGSLIAFQRRDLTPPAGVTHFRTADGSWNNIRDPKEGAAGTRFLRNVTNEAIRREMDSDPMDPDPRLVSRVLLTRTETKEIPFLNMLATAWINFMNHDWIHHGEAAREGAHRITLAEDDELRRRHLRKDIAVPRTQADPTRQAGNEETPLTFINEVTHWWDGSQIYGSDQAAVNRLRSGINGKLKLTPGGTLPLDNDGIEQTGFTRNWWVGLAMLHTLFVREHNAICDHLLIAYPNWDDNRLFNVARLINAAVMAKIHAVEWTPAILANRMVDGGSNANWYGLLTNMFNIGKQRRTVSKVNVRNLEMGGAVGNPVDKHGCPFALTEEFVEVYRLHSLLPDQLKIIRIGGDAREEIGLAETRQRGSAALVQKYGVEDLLYSFGNQHPGQLVLNNYPRFMQEISVPGAPLLDLGAVDILRARERGVPRYNEFRRQLLLNPICSFHDLTDDEDVIQKLEQVYGDQPADVEKLDLMIGTLAEHQSRRPEGFGFGETLFQIFILNATRRLQADRFFTDSYNEETYTREGLAWIDASDLKRVLIRNYPGLAQTGLGNIKNAFEPWDTDQHLDPERHPLRKFDKELRPSTCLGDRWRVMASSSTVGDDTV